MIWVVIGLIVYAALILVAMVLCGGGPALGDEQEKDSWDRWE